MATTVTATTITTYDDRREDPDDKQDNKKHGEKKEEDKKNGDGDEGSPIPGGNPTDEYVDLNDVIITYSSIYQSTAGDLGNLLQPNLVVGNGQGWNSGRFAPAWVKLQLRHPMAILVLQLVANTTPNCQAAYQITVENELGVITILRNEFLASDQMVMIPLNMMGVRSITITTTASRSWVAWKRVLLKARRG